MANSNKKPTMSWTEEKDIILMRQMTGFGIFEYRSGSRERGNIWQNIAQKLNEDERFGAALTARGARDRFTLLSRKQKAKTASELKSTGEGGKEPSEYDLLIEELVELSEESDKRFQEETESGKEKSNMERQKALDIRKQAMETMGQTRKRTGDKVDEDVKEKKKRRSGSDTMTWLEKKGEIDAEWRKKQLEDQRLERELMREERKEEMELQRKQLEMQMKVQDDMKNQQSLLMQQMLAMMQNQQQQFQAMLSKFKN